MTNIIRTSPLSGITHSMDIPLDSDEYEKRYNAYKNGMLIQDAFPMLTRSQKEFIMTGITDEEWNLYMAPVEE